MADVSKPLQLLADILQAGHAKPDLATDRLAPSTFYDLQYRMFVVAAAFETHAKPFNVTQRRINAGRLKLLQFIACRPWLLPVVRDWSQAQRDPQLFLLSSHRLRRGFIADSMHDNVMRFLVARAMFDWMDNHIIEGPQVSVLRQLYEATVRQELFLTERRVLEELVEVNITNNMLEGW